MRYSMGDPQRKCPMVSLDEQKEGLDHQSCCMISDARFDFHAAGWLALFLFFFFSFSWSFTFSYSILPLALTYRCMDDRCMSDEQTLWLAGWGASGALVSQVCPLLVLAVRKYNRPRELEGSGMIFVSMQVRLRLQILTYF